MSKLTEDIMLKMYDNRTETFEDRLESSQDRIKDSAKKSVAIVDSYGNSLLSIGNEDKSAQFTEYGMSNDTLNYPLWLALYNDSWVFKRAIDKPAQDEIRCGITLQGNDDFSNIYKYISKYTPDFIQLLQWGALFGGSVACVMFDNIPDEEYSKPIDVNKLRQAKSMKLYVTDRWYGVQQSDSTVSDMNSVDFGKPKFYTITMADGHMVKFHHDYILRYEHRSAPRLIKQGQLQGWGYAEGSHILNELMRDEKLKTSIQSLIDKSLIEVIKMAGMRGVFMGADADNEQQLRKRLEMVNWGRNFNSLTFLDKDDDYSQSTFGGLSGLADILQQNMWCIASALEMQGILFGDLKGGFSQDTEALTRYSETIKNRCELYVRPVYEKFLSIVYKIFDIKSKVEFEFNALSQKTEQNEYADSLQKVTQLLSQMLQDGVIDLSRYAKAIQTYADKGVLQLDLDDEYIKSLEDKEDDELENIDLENV